jgi:hypothetical protein
MDKNSTAVWVEKGPCLNQEQPYNKGGLCWLFFSNFQLSYLFHRFRWGVSKEIVQEAREEIPQVH